MTLTGFTDKNGTPIIEGNVLKGVGNRIFHLIYDGVFEYALVDIDLDIIEKLTQDVAAGLEVVW
jgi:hypothetical protein